MRKKYGKPLFHVQVKQATQISESHCGPAVIQMLLANLGIEVSQEAIAEAAGVTATIDEHGTRFDQLAQSVHKLAPDVQFWVKDHADISELVAILNEREYPVGVEWQGLFETMDEIMEDDDTEDEETDYGHYSIVSYIDPDNRQLIIVDPYKDFINQDRIFPIRVFRRRWWDTNEIIDPDTGRSRLVEDRRLMFILTPKSETFPLELGMKAL